jgi:polysaccharide deacetylase family protein (PEP-CTERM system associated)
VNIAPQAQTPTSARLPDIVNAFSIDVEDYFQVSAFEGAVDASQWGSIAGRVEQNTECLLEILDEAGVSATFFTLGWIAARHPRLVQRIASAGHEVASHGYGHQRVDGLSLADLRDDLVRARQLLEDTIGQRVIGYRAPSFSIGRHNLWVHALLAETGHAYSSSIYPIRHDHYGIPEAPRFAYRTSSGLTEIPATSLRLGGMNLPASGGGYFRLVPYSLSRWAIRQVNRRDRESAIFYCHPWEVDPQQPRVSGIDSKTRFRHYVNLSRTAPRIKRLLRDFAWSRIDAVFAHHLHVSAS